MNNNAIVSEYEAYLNRVYVERSTPQHYMSDLKIFLKSVGQKSVDKIDSRDLDDFVSQQQKAGMSAATINRRLAALHAFFEWLAGQEPEMTQVNPVIWKRHKPKQAQPIARDASDDEVVLLFNEIDGPRDQAIFGLMVGAGLRVGEVAALKTGDIYPPSNGCSLARLIVKGKGEKERSVWLTRIWYDKLLAYQAMRPASDEPHLFLNHRGQAITVNGIQYRLQTYCRQAELTLTCHQLRHTFARRLADQRMPIESISQLLGHSQVETTQLYTAGANPALQSEFEAAMAQLEIDSHERPAPDLPPFIRPARQTYPADDAELERALARYAAFPDWLRPTLEAHLKRCWHDWKPHMAAQHAHATARQLVVIWQWILDSFSPMAWHDICRTQIESWMDAQLERGLVASTVKRSYDYLYSLLRFAQDREVALHPQLFRVRPPQRPDSLPRHLSDDEYQRLLQTVLADTQEPASAPLHRTWFLTLAFTGIRLSELLDLRLSDLDLSTRRLFIHDAKNGEGRVAFLTPSLVRLLQSYLAWRPQTETDHLFVSDQGKPLTSSSIYYRCRKWASLADLQQLSPHRLRHTFATRLLNHDVPLESIRKLLGHRTLHMTQRYARLHDSTIQRHFEDATAHVEGILIPDWPQQNDHYVNTENQQLVNSM